MRLIQNLVHLSELYHSFVHIHEYVFIDTRLLPILDNHAIVVQHSVDRDGVVARFVQELYFRYVGSLGARKLGIFCVVLGNFRPCVGR